MNSDMDCVIGPNFKISMNKKLGSGAFGEIYHGEKYLYTKLLSFYLFLIIYLKKIKLIVLK